MKWIIFNVFLCVGGGYSLVLSLHEQKEQHLSVRNLTLWTPV